MPNLRSMHAAFMKVQAIPLAAFLLTLSTASLFGKEKNHVPLPAQVIYREDRLHRQSERRG